MEEDIPIDINAGKLLEWLINRRHCPKDWSKNVLIIREKINNAIQDMPANEEIVSLLSGTYINYFHCIKIVEILKQTEADTKNLFGRYGSQRMKDWQEILHLYEKDNIYLAEAAQMLMRNINYEVPSFKKQIQKLEQLEKEHEKKEADYKKSETVAQTEFNNLCKQFSISGNNIKRELVDKTSELPEIYKKLAEKVKSIENVIEYYSAFVKFTLGREHDGGCVPMLKYIAEKGNTTTYEWIYQEPPLSIEEPPLNISFSEDDNKIRDNVETENNEIDFGEIDFNVDLSSGDNANVNVVDEIDWGGIGAEGTDNNEGDFNSEIDFNITLEESGIIVEAAGHDGGAATGNEAYTILDNPKTRNEFINQLFELEAFLKMRLFELKADSNNVISFSQMQEAAAIIQLATVESTQNMLDNVQVLLSEILDSKLQHLHNIKHSTRYVDVLVSLLKEKLTLIEKMKASQKLVRKKRVESEEQAVALKPVLKLLIQRTKELKTEVEQDISKKYKNRIVHLTGAINAL
ncbi:CDK5RAP3 protein homolog [Prorops nasuta]|uniref:CDK5RAP3 protein homolog n=1 Tax=Prorops nasuta TaxID=863751 RepID=UPI0034CE8C9E